MSSSDTESVNLLVEAAEVKPSGAIAPALGPLGLNLGQVVADINKETANFKGMKVPVTINIDMVTKKYTIEVGLPPTSAMILNEIGLPKGSGQTGHEVIGDISFQQILNVANAKRADLLANSLGAAAREVLGTLVTMGITCDGLDPRAVQKKTLDGDYDDAIKNFK
ncbi:MAG: 50S ribosomal protein L11 [Candidatus Kariarchaeaceae archaeon]|jgi:large subunit ribosomal protein L11